MKVTVQELEPCKRQLLVEAPETEVAAAWEAAYGRVQREARLPGFRRGKVPRALVRVHFADEVRRSVAEQLVPDVYRRALDETRLQAVEDPEVQDLELEEGRPLRFRAVVEVKPVIRLADYRGVRVLHTPAAVTDADVESVLGSLAHRHATLGTVQRGARAGDHVIVDYTIEPEGAAPRSETNYAFRAGHGQVLPEMDEAVIGLEAGDQRQLTVRFAADHPREDLRSQSGRLALRLVEVKEEIVPDLDDEFARSVSSHQAIGALRAAVRTDLGAQRAREDRHRLEERVVDAVLATHRVASPEGLVAREVAQRVGRVRAEIIRGGVDPDAVSGHLTKLAEEMRPAAERAVRRALILEAIAQREEIAVSDTEVDAEVERIAEESGRAPQAVRSLLQRGGDLDGLRLGLREARVLKLLVEQADIHPEP